MNWCSSRQSALTGSAWSAARTNAVTVAPVNASFVMKSDAAASATLRARAGRAGGSDTGICASGSKPNPSSTTPASVSGRCCAAIAATIAPRDSPNRYTGSRAGAGAALLDPRQDRLHVGDRAVRRQPPALVARRRAVAAQIDGEDVEPRLGERVHEGPPLARDLEIEIRQAAPRAAVQQHDDRARLRGLLLPDGQVMAVDDDVVLDGLPRRLAAPTTPKQSNSDAGRTKAFCLRLLPSALPSLFP